MSRLVLTEQAELDLERLERATRMRVAAAIQRLILTNAGDIRKLRGIDPPEYRLRAGEWRVRFSRPDSDTVRINRVQDRKDAYR